MVDQKSNHGDRSEYEQGRKTRPSARVVAAAGILSLLGFGVMGVRLAQADTLEVCSTCDYTTIQAAVNAASPGDTINVAAGTYAEAVTINKNSLTINGAGAGADPSIHTIIDGPVGSASGIFVSHGVTGVTIQNLRVQEFANGGICAIGENHGFTVLNSQAISNTAGSGCLGGIYLNGPVNNVLISHNESAYNTSRGIVIWNGFKTNITITHNLVRNNNCCGIELQDGTASGVLVAHNVVRDNADNGIGLVGLTSGAGPNLIYSNTLYNNGRFGIEVKLPNGTGLTSGDGSIVVLSNTVALTDAIGTIKPGELRDLAGIAAFRRGWVSGNNNVDIPAGVVIQGNTVSGYQQPSDSDGFGIVVEGARMFVLDNTLEDNDVGVQVQAGHLPYTPFSSVDGDQANLADQYFGRGNSPVACAIEVAGNVFTGNTTNTREVGPTNVGGAVTNLNTGQTFCGIQAAIDAPPTLNGHVISVSAGVYSELISVTKQVTLLGAQHGQDADARAAAFVAGKADPTLESIVYTPINNPTGGNPGAADLFRVLTNSVTIDGFVLDGNNPALGASTVVVEGVDAHARRGVTNIGPNDSFNPLNSLILRNNVFQNFGQRGISLANNDPVSAGNLIERNVLRRIRDQAILLLSNAYADIVENTIDVPVSGIGLHLQNFSANGSMAWLSNTVTIMTDALGIHANLFYAPSATLAIQGNTVNADAASVAPEDAAWAWGINVWSVQVGSTVLVEGNRVGDAGGRLGRGINVWNVPTARTVEVVGNQVARSTIGINFDNVDPYYGGGASSILRVTGNTVTGVADGVGLRVRAAILEEPPLYAANAVNGHGLMIVSDTNVTGAGVGLLVESGITSTFAASATLHNSALTNNDIGVQIVKGALTATSNQILSNTVGVTNTGGVPTDVWVNRNAIAGNTVLGVGNDAGGVLDATCNWYGDPSGPSGVGPGSGDSVSANVDYNPWLLSNDLNGPCAGATLVVEKVVSGPITPTTSWNFTAAVPTGTLAFTLPAGGGAVTFTGLDFGPTLITETTKPGYVATSACSTGATGSDAISLTLTGAVTCTFTNTITPTTTVITVTPVLTNGWAYITEPVGVGVFAVPFDIVLPPPDPTLGNASARMVLTDVNWRHMYVSPIFTGALLRDITVFEYRLRFPASGGQTPYINIGWDDDASDSNTGFRGRLVYSPGSLTPDTWHVVDARNDTTPRWYTTLPGATQCIQSSPCTFEQIVAVYPNAAIHPGDLMGAPLGFVGIRVGGGSSTGIGYADGLRVGVGDQITLYDFEAAPPTTITLTADPAITEVGGSAVLTATVLIANGDPAADGTVVSFDTTIGAVSPVTVTTFGGVATAAVNSTVAGVATVTASAGDVDVTAQVTFTAGAPFTVMLVADPTTLAVGNSSTLTATVTDQYGNAVADGTAVSFTTDLGTLGSATLNTSAGQVVNTLGSTTPGVATVTATVGSLNATAQVTFTPGAPFTVSLSLTPAIIYANGISQSVAVATVTDQYGNPVPGVSVSFFAGVGTFIPAAGTTNSAGQVTVNLTSLTPAIENVFAVVSGVGYAQAQAIYTNPPAATAPLTGTLGTLTQTFDVVRKGGLITYTLQVTNTGAGQLNNVLIYAPIPSGTTYVPGSASGGNYSPSNVLLLSGEGRPAAPFGPRAVLNAVTWAGDLPGGASHTLSYVVQAQILEGQVVNQPKVFVDNADTGIDLSSTVNVVAYKFFLPVAYR